jgi:hypothetical protein
MDELQYPRYRNNTCPIRPESSLGCYTSRKSTLEDTLKQTLAMRLRFAGLG